MCASMSAAAQCWPGYEQLTQIEKNDMRLKSTAESLQKELLESPERRYTPEVPLLSSDGSGLALADSKGTPARRAASRRRERLYIDGLTPLLRR
jgi:hypothetical protein